MAVDYKKKTDTELTDIAKKYGAEIDAIAKKLSGKVTAAEKKSLSAKQMTANSYYIPARQELLNRGYSVVGATVMKFVTKPKDTTPSTAKSIPRVYIPTDTSKPFSPVPTVTEFYSKKKTGMVVVGALLIGAVYWFFIRKKPSAVKA